MDELKAFGEGYRESVDCWEAVLAALKVGALKIIRKVS